MEDVVNAAFWAGRRVFLTGHTGFKGAWLALWLQSLGAEVTGFSLDPPTQPSLFEACRISDSMQDLRGDIREAPALAAALAAARPDVVFHLAAQSLVRASYADPVDTYLTNVMGTVHLLEAVRQHSGSVRAVVNVTSDKCYQNREWLWGYRETDALGGHDPYSNSKACAELVTAAYRASFFGAAPGDPIQPRLATARAGNVIGGGDWAADRLVPDMIRAFSDKRAVVIRHPEAVRPWQHVLDPLSGYLRLAEELCNGGEDAAEGWNFGPAEDEARPVSWIVSQLARAWGDGASWQHDAAAQPHEAAMLRLDCSKAWGRLGWRSRWSLDESLRRVVAWHRAHLDRADMRAFSLAQLTDYSLSASL